jgi:predicted nicotinamide N-methyase
MAPSPPALARAVLRGAPISDLVALARALPASDVADAITAVLAHDLLPHPSYLQRASEALISVCGPSDELYELLGRGLGTDDVCGGHLTFFLRDQSLPSPSSPLPPTCSSPLSRFAEFAGRGWRVWSSARLSDVSDTLWPASFHLINAAVGLDDGSLFSGRRVLELGAGTGLAGGVIASLLPVASVTLADVDPRACECLRAFAASLAGPFPVLVERLDWISLARDAGAGDVPCSQCLRAGPRAWVRRPGGCGHSPPPAIAALRDDCSLQVPGAPLAIVGSDLVYLPEAVEPLAATLAALLIPCDNEMDAPEGGDLAPFETCTSAILTFLRRRTSTVGAASHSPLRAFCLLASTRRNPSTYALLLSSLRLHGLVHCDVTALADDLARRLVGGDGAVLDLGPDGHAPEGGGAGGGTAHAHDIRVALIVHGITAAEAVGMRSERMKTAIACTRLP